MKPILLSLLGSFIWCLFAVPQFIQKQGGNVADVVFHLHPAIYAGVFVSTYVLGWVLDIWLKNNVAKVIGVAVFGFLMSLLFFPALSINFERVAASI